MSILGLMGGTDVLLVGIEEQDDGGLRLYLGHRSEGTYAVVYDEDAKEAVRNHWHGSRHHATVTMPPPECIYREDAA